MSNELEKTDANGIPLILDLTDLYIRIGYTAVGLAPVQWDADQTRRVVYRIAQMIRGEIHGNTPEKKRAHAADWAILSVLILCVFEAAWLLTADSIFFWVLIGWGVACLFWTAIIDYSLRPRFKEAWSSLPREAQRE